MEELQMITRLVLKITGFVFAVHEPDLTCGLTDDLTASSSENYRQNSGHFVHTFDALFSLYSIYNQSILITLTYETKVMSDGYH